MPRKTAKYCVLTFTRYLYLNVPVSELNLQLQPKIILSTIFYIHRRLFLDIWYTVEDNKGKTLRNVKIASGLSTTLGQSKHSNLGGLFEHTKLRLADWLMKTSIWGRSSHVTDRLYFGSRGIYQRIEDWLFIQSTKFSSIMLWINPEWYQNTRRRL